MMVGRKPQHADGINDDMPRFQRLVLQAVSQNRIALKVLAAEMGGISEKAAGKKLQGDIGLTYHDIDVLCRYAGLLFVSEELYEANDQIGRAFACLMPDPKSNQLRKALRVQLRERIDRQLERLKRGEDVDDPVIDHAALRALGAPEEQDPMDLMVNAVLHRYRTGDHDAADLLDGEDLAMQLNRGLL